MSAIPHYGVSRKSLVKRTFFLRQAAERATDPEFKALWERKKSELLVKHRRISMN